jgi:hypothetical protein
VERRFLHRLPFTRDCNAPFSVRRALKRYVLGQLWVESGCSTPYHSRMWMAVVGGALAAFSPVALPAAHDATPRFVLIESGGGLGVDVENTTVFSVDGSQPSAWFLSRDTNESNWCGRAINGQCRPTKTSGDDWIDGRNCPALGDIMKQLLTVRTAERGSSHPQLSDTPLLSLVVLKGAGMATDRLGEYEGPLVDWWRSAQERLKTCWAKTRPF